MHKILLYLGTRQALLTLLLLFIVFFFPKTVTLAKTVPECANKPSDASGAIGGALKGEVNSPNDCPNEATCYVNFVTRDKPHYYCFKDAPPGAAAAAPAEDDCKKDPKKCTSGGGQRCLAGPGTLDPNGTGILTAIGCIPTEPKALVEGLLKYGTVAAGAIAFILMLLGALGLITAEGNPEAIKQSQERFYSAIIGLLFIIFAVLLMQVIGVDILGLPGFGS